MVSYYFIFPPLLVTTQVQRVCLKYNVCINISSYRLYYHHCMLWINCINMVWLLLFFALLCTCSLCLRCISSSSTCQLTVYFCYVLSTSTHFKVIFFCCKKKKKRKRKEVHIHIYISHNPFHDPYRKLTMPGHEHFSSYSVYEWEKIGIWLKNHYR